ncbi:MAG: hypothetical protein U1A27_12100 [Phycisphaerae bacterium]
MNARLLCVAPRSAATPCRPAAISAVALLLLSVAAVSAGDPPKRGLFDWLKPRPGAAAGEEWTIECAVFRGEDHRRNAETFANSLRAVRELHADQVVVEPGDGQSTLYYGLYRLSRDPKTDMIVFSPELQRDKNLIRSLSPAPDQFPFLTAKPVPRPEHNTGPADWNLANARGAYTLQVGVTYNTAGFHERMAGAVEWVKDLRSRGFEAYYYHDPRSAKSLVCVGLFDEGAVRVGPDGRPQYSDAVRKLRAQAEFQYNLENGARVSTVQPDGSKRVNESFLVRVPQRAAAAR